MVVSGYYMSIQIARLVNEGHDVYRRGVWRELAEVGLAEPRLGKEVPVVGSVRDKLTGPTQKEVVQIA